MTKTTKISLAVIAVLVLSLVGGYIGAGLRGGGSGSAAETGSWLDKIKESGELRVGVAISPPMTVEKDGVLGGPNLIPAQMLADQLGVKLTPVSAQWSNIVAGLQADRYDIAANLDSTLERSLSIQFSDAVYEYQGVFVVPESSQYNTSSSILDSGQLVATAAGSADNDAVKSVGAKVLEVPEYTNALQAVQANRAIAVFADLPTAESQVLANPSFKIVVPDPTIYETGAGYGLPNDIDPRSLQVVNIAINNARQSGVLERAYAEENYVPITELGDLQKR